MPYLLNSAQDVQSMLQAIGVSSLEELLTQVPAGVRLNRPLNVPPAMAELELTAHMQQLAGQNESAEDKVCFLGGGAYDHFVPAVVDHLASRGEYYTSYTPYQAEASQGTLQVMFEYQTLITQLTGLEISNASLYEGGTAAVEAVFMAINHTRRSGKVVTASSVHPEYRQILGTYLHNIGVEIQTVGTPEGHLELDDLAQAIDDQTACVLVQHPNFFGQLEHVEALAEYAHKQGALFIVAFDPISLGLLKRPGDYQADIAIAEGQPLGNHLSFGGPYLGLMACREELMRKLPGRLVGQTTDQRGNRCWVLTLQTREQHIRRDRATSNICTNQGLLALRASIYLALMGPQGLREVAELCLRKAAYAKEQLTAGKLSPAFAGPHFKEFVLRVPGGEAAELAAELEASGYFAGIPLRRWYPELADCLLVAVTEKRTRGEIDQLANLVADSRVLQNGRARQAEPSGSAVSC